MRACERASMLVCVHAPVGVLRFLSWLRLPGPGGCPACLCMHLCMHACMQALAALVHVFRPSSTIGRAAPLFYFFRRRGKAMTRYGRSLARDDLPPSHKLPPLPSLMSNTIACGLKQA